MTCPTPVSRPRLELAAIAQRIETGTVWINHMHAFSPDIAFGIEDSLHGLALHTNTQTPMRKALASPRRKDLPWKHPSEP